MKLASDERLDLTDTLAVNYQNLKVALHTIPTTGLIISGGDTIEDFLKRKSAESIASRY